MARLLSCAPLLSSEIGSLTRFLSLLLIACTSGQGETGTLSSPRSSLAATSVGDLALFAGGWSHAGEFSCVDVYDAVSGDWSTESLSGYRAELVAASVGHLAFFAGGLDGSYCYSGVDIYDSSTNTWHISGLSQPRWGLAAATLGQRVFFAGGWTGGDLFTEGVASDRVDIFDTSSNTWSQATLSVARCKLAAVAVGDIVMFAGGLTSDCDASAQVDIFSSSTGQWSTASLFVARSYLAGTSVGELALFAGGDDNNGPVAHVDIYNYSSGTWGTSSLSLPRDRLTANSLYGLAIFAGGNAAFGAGSSSQVDIYHASSNTWAAATLSQPRSNLASTVVNNLLILAGGVVVGAGFPGTANYSAQVDIFDAVSGTWSPGLCQPGYWTNSSSIVVCEECASGTYAPTVSSSGCLPCADMTHSESGSASCFASKEPMIIALSVGVPLLVILFVCGAVFYYRRKRQPRYLPLPVNEPMTE